MVQADIVEIAHRREKKFFTLEEARNLLPVIRKVTGKVASRVEVLLQKLDAIDLENTEEIVILEAEANALIEEWHDKMSKLGVKAKGLWYVDFDNGSNYYCWKFPEDDIFYTHTYEDGFTGRVLIDKSHPLPEQLEGCENGHNETGLPWAENRTRTDKLTPWRV